MTDPITMFFMIIAALATIFLLLAIRALVKDERKMLVQASTIAAQKAEIERQEGIVAAQAVELKRLVQRNRMLSIEVRGGDPLAKTDVWREAKPNPNQTRPERGQVAYRLVPGVGLVEVS